MSSLKSLIDYQNPNSLGSRLRKRRFRRIEAIVRSVLAEKKLCRIIDVGGTGSYWALMDPELLNRCHVAIVNLNTPRGDDPARAVPPHGHFDFVTGDGRSLADVGDGEYDISHSNSVIEHVGLYKDMKQFAAESQRIGKHFYVQTPYFWFPIEPHFGAPLIHWMPVSWRVKLLTRFRIGFKQRFETTEAAMDYIEFINLIDAKAARSLFPGAHISYEYFLFFPKSLVIYGQR